jgi:hypothetical protein
MTSTGYDISWPQCQFDVPAPPYGFGVVGVTGGRLFSSNPCLHDQWMWARSHGSFGGVYINSNAYTADQLKAFFIGGGRKCGLDQWCALYQWGRQGAAQAIKEARDIAVPMWWIDVETGNEWLPDPIANATVIRGMIDELQQSGRKVGIYSTSLQWGNIAGAYSPNLPTWIPGAPPDAVLTYCDAHSFGGGTAWMVQSGLAGYDWDVLCPAGNAHYRESFADPLPVPVPVYVDTPVPHASRVDAAGLPYATEATLTSPIVPVPGRVAAPATHLALAAPVRTPTPHHPWPAVALAVALLAVVGVAGSRRRLSPLGSEALVPTTAD